MKIVTCITRLIRGGAQRIALETAAHLAARGHDASLWCGPETGPEGSLHEEAAARGVPVRIFPNLRRAVDPWHDVRALADLTGALRAERPDLFHTHSSKAGILGRDAGRRAGLARVVHTVHGWGFTPATPAWMIAGFIALERRCASVGPMVFVNPGDREDGLRRGIVPHSESRVIAPGIDLSPYENPQTLREIGRAARQSLRLPEGAIVGGFLGRLSEQKAPEIVLEVAAVTANFERQLHWIVVGGGPMAEALREQTAAMRSLAGRVHWMGLQTDPAPWLAAMDFLVLPSRWEGAPLTLMEAMAAGLPVVASDLPGIRWVLEGTRDAGDAPGDATGKSRTEPQATRGACPDGPTGRSDSHRPGQSPDRPPGQPAGLLVPQGDVPRFASAVEHLAGDAGARARLGAAARAIALERLGIDAMIEKLLYLYAAHRC